MFIFEVLPGSYTTRIGRTRVQEEEEEGTYYVPPNPIFSKNGRPCPQISCKLLHISYRLLNNSVILKHIDTSSEKSQKCTKLQGNQ